MLPTLARMERGKLSFVKVSLPTIPDLQISSRPQYINITARATRQALKEEERVKSDKRGDVGLRYRVYSSRSC
jgi:hypothetical protein